MSAPAFRTNTWSGIEQVQPGNILLTFAQDPQQRKTGSYSHGEERHALASITLRPENVGNVQNSDIVPVDLYLGTRPLSMTGNYLKDLVSAEGIEPSTY